MFERKSKTTSIPVSPKPAAHPLRRQDRYRRGMFDLTKQYIEQNEKIIDLLIEIRDRLPQR